MSGERKILLVDDDPRNIFALSAILRAKKLSFFTASDTREARELLLQNNNIAVVLLDMMLPETDGYETIGILRALPGYSALPIIAVTAQAMTGDREKCLAAGADDYISKPIDVDQLMVVLNRYLK